MRPLEIDPDICRARTLPAWFYRDPESLEWARRHVFPRSWQLLAPLEAVRTPRQAHPETLLPGCLDEPLLLVRDDDDRLHCLSNVCTHRGALVAEEPCRATTLRCPYHGRRFGLDGRFLSMPEFERTADFPTAADDLPAVPLATWGPFAFASLEPAMPFESFIAPVQERVGWLPLDELVFDPGRSRDYLVRANWALYCENYLEGFHIPFVHAALATVVDYGTYRTELHEWGNLQIGLATGGEAAFELPPGSPDAGQDVAAYWYWLFPNLMLNF
ncbi:MAG: aromatic ring-hydroxylating oxygenase subunit alpha, partial [Planctomycetota bacterium]